MENETSEMIVKRVSVPIGLEELMEGLSKEVLLKKPDDLYEFAARYFSKLLLLRDKTNYKAKTVRSAQTVTEQNRRLTRAPYGTASKTLSRQISIRDNSSTRRSQLRHIHNASPKRHINPRSDTSLTSKREPSKMSKNEGTEQSSTKKIENTNDQLEPSVNKVSLSSRRPKRRYDSKGSLSRDNIESQGKGIKSSNASVSESADTIERTEMMPKRRESNSSTLSNVPSLESSETKFNTDSPIKAPKDAVIEASPMNTPRDNPSTTESKISKRDVDASKSSGEDKAQALSGTKFIRDGKVTNKSTFKVSPRSDSSKYDTPMNSDSEGRYSKVTPRRSPSKDSSKAKSLNDEHVNDQSLKNDSSGSTDSMPRSSGDKSRNNLPVAPKTGDAKQHTNSLTDTSITNQSTGKDRIKQEGSHSGDLRDSDVNKDTAAHSVVENISNSGSEAYNKKPKNNVSETSTKVDGNVKSQKDSSKHLPSADKSQKNLHKHSSMSPDSTGKSKINNDTLKGTPRESASEDKLRTKSSNNEDKNSSAGIQNITNTKSASNAPLDQNNQEHTDRNSESESNDSTKSYSKKSKPEDDGKKCSQTTPESKAENDRNSCIAIPGTHPEKLLTGENEKSIYKGDGSKQAANQNSTGGDSGTSRGEANENNNTKMLQKEESEYISLSKDDNQKDCTSLLKSTTDISKKSLREGNNKSIDKSSTKHNPSAAKSSSEESHGRSTTSGLGIQECGAKSDTLEDPPLSDGPPRKNDQKETDLSSKFKYQAPQRDQIRRKSDSKDTHVNYELTKYTYEDKSSSDKTLPHDESSKMDEKDVSLSSRNNKSKEGTVEDTDKDIFKSCRSSSRETSRSDEPVGISHYAENEDNFNQNTKSTSNVNHTVTRLGQQQINDFKNMDDLSSLDVVRDEKRASYEKSGPVKSSENSSEDKSKCGYESEVTKLNEKSVNSQPSVKDTKNRPMHSVTSELQSDKALEHEDNNRSSLKKKSEEIFTADKQLQSLRLKPSESEVTSNSESNKGVLLTNEKDTIRRSDQTSGNGSSVLSSSKVEKQYLSNSKERLPSTDPSDSRLVIQNEKNDMTIDAERKPNQGNSEMKQNVDFTNSSGTVDPKDCNQVSDVAKISQDVHKLKVDGSGIHSDPKKSKIGADDAKIAEDMTVSLIGKGMHDKSPKKSEAYSFDVNGTNISEKIGNQIEPPKKIEHDTKSSSSGISNTETKTVDAEPKVSNISSNDKKSSETASANFDPSSDVHKSLADCSDKEHKDQLSHVVEDYSVKSLSNSKIGSYTTGSTKQITSGSNESISINDTTSDEILDKTDRMDKHARTEQNTNTSSNKSGSNEDKEAERLIINAKATNNLPNTSGQREETEKVDSTEKQDLEVGAETVNQNGRDFSKTGDKNITDKPRENSKEKQAPTVTDIASKKEMTDSNKKIEKVDEMLNLPTNFSETTDRTEVGMDKNSTTVAVKATNVNNNLTESTQAVSVTTGSELKSPSLAGANSSTQINIETAKSAIEASEKSNNEAYVVDKDADSVAKFSKSDPSKNSTVSHESSSITSNNLKSNDKKQKSPDEMNQVGLLIDSKHKSARTSISSPKSASKKKPADSQKSSSLEIGDKPISPDSNRSGSSSIKSRSKKTPRVDNGLRASDDAKKSAINLRDNSDKVPTSKSGQSGVISKNQHLSPEKSLPENQQQNSKDSTVASMSGNSSSSSAVSSKVSSNKTQSVDSGNNSLTTSSSEKEVTKEQSNVIESQSHEKQKLPSSHKRALHRSSKVDERSSKSLSNSKRSSSNTENQTNPTVSNEKPPTIVKNEIMREGPKNSGRVQNSAHPNVSEEKGFVADKSEQRSKDPNRKPISSGPVDKKINDKEKVSIEAQSENSGGAQKSAQSNNSEAKGFVADKSEKPSKDPNRKPISSVPVDKKINDRAKVSIEAQSENSGIVQKSAQSNNSEEKGFVADKSENPPKDPIRKPISSVPVDKEINDRANASIEAQSGNSARAQKPANSNDSEEKGFVVDKNGKPSKDPNRISSSLVDEEINDRAKASIEKQSGSLSQDALPNTVPKISSSEGSGRNLDSSENGSFSKASKIPIKISDVEGSRANDSGRANAVSSALNTNLLSVDNFELEKEEAQKMKQKLEESNVHHLNDHEKNDPRGISEEDRLILEKLNISHTDIDKDNGTNSSKQAVDQTRGSMNSSAVGVNAVTLHQVSNNAEDGQATTVYENKALLSTDLGEQKPGGDVTVGSREVPGDGQSRSEAEASQLAIDRGNDLNDDGVQDIPLDKIHTEHTNDVGRTIRAKDSIVHENKYSQNHPISKREAERHDDEKSAMNKAGGHDGTTNAIHQTLQHKEKLHPDVKGLISQFIEQEQANVYKEHCLCREVRLHDDEDGAEISFEEQKQVVNRDKAESSNSDKPSTRPPIEKVSTSNNQSKMDNSAQVKTDLLGLTLRYKDGLNPDVKGLISNFIEQEQANVYKEYFSCREVKLHNTVDESGQNDDKQPSDADQHPTTIQKQRSEETTTVVDPKAFKRGQSVDSARPNGYLNYKIPTAEVKGIQALTVQGRNGNYINKSNEYSEGSSTFDITKLREELEKVQDESKMNTFNNSYNPYKLRQELKQYSSETGTVSDRNNNTHKTFSAANAVLKIQSMWRGFLVRKVLKRGEILGKNNSPVGVLKSGTEQKVHDSATVIANGGHKIPKDTKISDAPIVASPPIEASEKPESRFESPKSSQTFSDGLDKSATAPPASDTCKPEKEDELMKHTQAASMGVPKTKSEHRHDQGAQSSNAETANGGQKIPKDAQIFDTAHETSKNIRQRIGDASDNTEKNKNDLEAQASSKPFSNRFDTPAGVAAVRPGSKPSTSERGEELVKQVTSYGSLEAGTGHRSEELNSSETLTVNDGQTIIPTDIQMSVGQSGEASLRDLDISKSISRGSELSSDNHSSGTIPNYGLKMLKDTRMTETSSDSNIKDPAKHNNEDSKKSDGGISSLESQESSKTSGAVDDLLSSEATKEDTEELEKAATALQSMWRGLKARKGSNVENRKMEEYSARRKRKIEDKDMRKVSSISKEDAAALKIQSIWKAYVARKGIVKFKNTLITKKEKKQLDDENAAATKIQAHVRGHLVRKKVDHGKQSCDNTKEYRPTSIESTDSAVTVIYRGLLDDDEYDSLNYDAAIDHAAHMPLLKDEGSITDYQNKLLAQISGKSEETTQNGEAQKKPSKDTEQSEVMSTDERKKTVIEAADKDIIDIATTSKSSSIDSKPSPVSIIHDVPAAPKSKAGHETANDINAVEQKANDTRPHTRRGRVENEEDKGKSVPSPVTENPDTTKVALAKNEDSGEASHVDMKGASLKASSECSAGDPDIAVIGQKDQKSSNSNNTKVKELEVAAKQSYVTTKEESNHSDGLRSTGEFHDVVTIPYHEPNKNEIFTSDRTAHKRDSAVEKMNNSSSIAVSEKGSQVSPKNTEPQENEQPDEEKSSESSLEKMYLHHSSEMHDSILFPVGSEEGDSQKFESKDDSKGTKPEKHKLLEGGNGYDGLRHSSEYHDSIVFPVKPDNKEEDLPSGSDSETNKTKGDSQQVEAPKDAKSEEVSAEGGQKLKEHPSTENKDLDGLGENNTSSSPAGLRHSSELHDAVIMPEMPYKEGDTSKKKNDSKHWAGLKEEVAAAEGGTSG